MVWSGGRLRPARLARVAGAEGIPSVPPPDKDGRGKRKCGGTGRARAARVMSSLQLAAAVRPLSACDAN